MYTAIITRNFRDVNTTMIKVLLLNIRDENGNLFRDHCWVLISKKINKFIPLNNKYTNKIKFSAKIKEYKTISCKKTLCAIKKIEYINL